MMKKLFVIKLDMRHLFSILNDKNVLKLRREESEASKDLITRGSAIIHFVIDWTMNTLKMFSKFYSKARKKEKC